MWMSLFLLVFVAFISMLLFVLKGCLLFVVCRNDLAGSILSIFIDMFPVDFVTRAESISTQQVAVSEVEKSGLASMEFEGDSQTVISTL